MRYRYVICITILLLYSLLKNNNKHLFWTSDQPIYTISDKNGVVKEINDLKTVRPNKNMSIIEFNLDDLDQFLNFINKYFDEAILYTMPYLKYQLGDNYILYGLKLNNNIIGTISGKYGKISINENIYKFIYVDYLSIIHEYRNNNYAPMLISCIINKMKQINYSIAYYRSDKKKHHFKHFYKSAYYYYKILDNTVLDNTVLDNTTKNYLDYEEYEVGNHSMFTQLYKIFINKCKTFKIYEIINSKIFLQKINNPFLKTVVYSKNNKIICFISYLNVKYKIYNKYENVAEIQYFFFNNTTDIPIVIDNFIYKINKNIKFIILLNNLYNNEIVKYLDMTKTDDTYFYFYNYSLNKEYTFENTLLF